MANVLCVIEVTGGIPRPVCLEALGEARRIGSSLGATVYAVVPLPRAPAFAEDDLIAVLSRHGADKVVLVTDEALGDDAQPMRWGTHGVAIGAASDLLPPSLLLFGATVGSREVAARAAARLGAAYMPEAWLQVESERLVVFSGSGDRASVLDGDIEFPVVATIPPGRYATAEGDDEAEVEVITASGRTPDFEEMGPDGEAPAALILCEPGAALSAAAALAIALHGEVRPKEDVEAPLVVSLGPPGGANIEEVRVALGAEAAAQPDMHYAIEGDAAALALALAEAVKQP